MTSFVPRWSKELLARYNALGALDKAFENIDCMSATLRYQAKNRFYESTQWCARPSWRDPAGERPARVRPYRAAR
jgi:hypothetical protein